MSSKGKKRKKEFEKREKKRRENMERWILYKAALERGDMGEAMRRIAKLGMD
jgi:hypothetical protein